MRHWMSFNQLRDNNNSYSQAQVHRTSWHLLNSPAISNKRNPRRYLAWTARLVHHLKPDGFPFDCKSNEERWSGAEWRKSKQTRVGEVEWSVAFLRYICLFYALLHFFSFRLPTDVEEKKEKQRKKRAFLLISFSRWNCFCVAISSVCTSSRDVHWLSNIIFRPRCVCVFVSERVAG